MNMEKKVHYFPVQMPGDIREFDKEQVCVIKHKKPLWIKGFGNHPVEATQEFVAEKLPSTRPQGLTYFRSLEDVRVRKYRDVWTMKINTEFSTFAANAKRIDVKV